MVRFRFSVGRPLWLQHKLGVITVLMIGGWTTIKAEHTPPCLASFSPSHFALALYSSPNCFVKPNRHGCSKMEAPSLNGSIYWCHYSLTSPLNYRFSSESEIREAAGRGKYRRHGVGMKRLVQTLDAPPLSNLKRNSACRAFCGVSMVSMNAFCPIGGSVNFRVRHRDCWQCLGCHIIPNTA